MCYLYECILETLIIHLTIIMCTCLYYNNYIIVRFMHKYFVMYAVLNIMNAVTIIYDLSAINYVCYRPEYISIIYV